MARQPRLIVPDVALHIVQRGVDRGDCFREETDRVVYLSLLRELCRETACAVHAYCLMTNHVHLLLTPSSGRGPSTLMRKLGQRYVPYFNRRYARTGTLWEGRFKSCLVESARYVLGCHRYIECNPVRAGMVNTPATYPWSSYRANAGLSTDPLLTPHVEYVALAETPSRHAAYRGLFETAEDSAMVKAIREATNGGYPLIGDVLKRQLAKKPVRTLERRRPGPSPRNPSEREGANAQLSFDEDPVLTPN